MPASSSASTSGMALLEPRCDGGIEFVDMAGEEVVGAFGDHQLIFPRQCTNDPLDFPPLAELIICSVNK